MTVAAGALGLWNIDMSRHARESLPPATYLGSGYYEIWIRGLEALLQQRGIPMRGGQAQGAKPMAGKAPDAHAMAEILRAGVPASKEPGRPASFSAGDTVRARNMHPAGHTRLPRYVRGHAGTIEAVAGFHVFPDSRAGGWGDDPQWLYTVRFNAAELFGESAGPGHFVHVDCFEPYLEHA
jgi:nitrile hydratase